MRITSELISAAEEVMNPLGDREILMRGLNIPTIENLGTLKDSFQTIDLSDNDVTHLAGFPLLKRLHNLIITRNSIVSVLSNIGRMLPNLKELVMTDNRLDSFNELDKLGSLAKLTTLVLVGNPVTNRHLYREFLIYKLAVLEVLDFRRVTLAEKREAKRIFETTPEGKKLVNSIGAGVLVRGEKRKDGAAFSTTTTTTTMKGAAAEEEENAVSTTANGKSHKKQKNALAAPIMIEAEDEMERKRFIREAILNAKSVEETGRLENALASGMTLKELKATLTAETTARTTTTKAEENVVVQSPQVSSATQQIVVEEKIDTAAGAAPAPSQAAEEADDHHHQEKEESREPDFEAMKVTELKEELKKRKLPTTGNKAELIARLKEQATTTTTTTTTPQPKRQKVAV